MLRRKLIVMVALWLVAVGAQAQTMTVEMKRAGMMWYYADYRDARLARSIKVVGGINGDDIRQLRELAGGKFGRELDETADGILESLDLSEATIAAGGGAFRFLGLYPVSHVSRIYPEMSMVYTKENAVDQGMFSGCTQLKSVTLPSTLASVNLDAFSDCEQLQTVVCPAAEPPVAVAEKEAVSGCDLVVPVGSGERYAEAEGWRDFRSISERDLSASAGVFTYQGLTYRTTGDDTAELTGYNVEDERLTVPEKAEHNGRFYTVVGIGSVTSPTFNARVKTVVLPPTIRYIGSYAFASFAELSTINFPEGLEEIGASAFENANSLTEVSLPNSVKTVGSNAFNECLRLKSVTLGDGVEVVGRCAFNGLPADTLELPATLQAIGGLAFNGNMKTIVCHVEEPIALIGEKGRMLEQEGHEFNEYLYKQTHLYVPDESVERYREAEVWKKMNVHPMSELVTTSVDAVRQIPVDTATGLYTVDGQRQQRLQRGVNIVKGDGTVQKVLKN